MGGVKKKMGKGDEKRVQGAGTGIQNLDKGEKDFLWRPKGRARQRGGKTC